MYLLVWRFLRHPASRVESKKWQYPKSNFPTVHSQIIIFSHQQKHGGWLNIVKLLFPFKYESEKNEILSVTFYSKPWFRLGSPPYVFPLRPNVINVSCLWLLFVFRWWWCFSDKKMYSIKVHALTWLSNKAQELKTLSALQHYSTKPRIFSWFKPIIWEYKHCFLLHLKVLIFLDHKWPSLSINNLLCKNKHNSPMYD